MPSHSPPSLIHHPLRFALAAFDGVGRGDGDFRRHADQAFDEVGEVSRGLGVRIRRQARIGFDLTVMASSAPSRVRRIW